MAAVDLLRRLGIKAWKVASGEITNLSMLGDMARDQIPVMISSGMSPWTEIDAAVEIVRRNAAPFAVFQCTTKYPSPPDSIGLNVLGGMRQRYGSAVGLSDHSATIYPALAAVAEYRAEVIEVHLTLSRDMYGPDVAASVTSAELQQICQGVRFIEAMRGSPIDKSQVAPDIAPMRKIFFKSIVPLADLPAGTVLSKSVLGMKKPGTGIPAAKLNDIVGRTLSRPVSRDVPLQYEDLS
jgi:N-acetylneuraminate synthase